MSEHVTEVGVHRLGAAVQLPRLVDGVCSAAGDDEASEPVALVLGLRAFEFSARRAVLPRATCCRMDFRECGGAGVVGGPTQHGADGRRAAVAEDGAVHLVGEVAGADQ